LLAEVEGMVLKEACRLFVDLSGVKSLYDDTKGQKSDRRKPGSSIKPASPPREDPPSPRPFDFNVLAPMDLDADEVEAIATTRCVSARSIEILMRWKCIHRVTLSPDLKLPIPREGRPLGAWAMHSPNWDSFRVRPFVGVFNGFDGQKYKSLTPSGGSCVSPIWVGPAHAQCVLLVEGEGDAIGAVEVIRREGNSEGLAVVCIFSSSIGIPSPFLRRFEGRRIRIVPHVGDARRQGEVAAVKWAASLKPWAAAVEIFSLAGLVMPDGRSVSDLGDLAQCADEVLSRCCGVSSW